MTTVLIILAVLAAGLYGWYAVIVARRNKVGEALGGIDAQLQQRHDLIPNVLAVAKRFLDHEKGLLNELTELRARAMPQVGERDFAKIAEKFRTEGQIGTDLARIFALAENYPELTSSGPMIEAQQAYRDVENNIAAARRFYNSAVNGLRTIVEIFPGAMLAGIAGVTTLPPFYEASEGAAVPVDAAKHL